MRRAGWPTTRGPPPGSRPSPSARCPARRKLQAAYADYDAGKIDQERARGRAGRGRQGLDRAAGGDRLADHLRRRAALVELRDLPDHRHARRHRPGRQPRPAGGQYFAIFADGHNRQLPRLTGGPFRYKTYAADTLKKSIAYANKPMKQAVIAPSMLALLYPLDERGARLLARASSRRTWSTSARRTSGRRFEAGAARVSVDFTEGRLATRDDPRNPWTGRGHAAALHRAEQPRARPLLAGGAHEHRHPHLPGRRPRLGAQRRRALQRPAAAACSRSTPATS